MRTELRFLLAIVLMFVVLMGTNLLFPPVPPEQPTGPSADTTAAAPPAGAGAPGTVGPVDTGGAPAGAINPTVPDRSQPGGAVATPAEPATEQRLLVETPLYRLEFSSLGARLLSAELPQFLALNREGVVQLVPDGSDDLFGQRLVVGQDTVDLRRAPFRAEPEGGLSLAAGTGPATQRFVYEHPTAPLRFEIDYTFDSDLYLVGVRGRLAGLDSRLLLTSLGDGLAFSEADSASEAGMMAYVYNHLRNGIESESVRRADPGIVPGPLVWAALRSKFFVTAMLAGPSDETLADRDYLGGLIVRESELPTGCTSPRRRRSGTTGGFDYRLSSVRRSTRASRRSARAWRR
jgi:YidC/Oxa1 family membrane protein insertase